MRDRQAPEDEPLGKEVWEKPQVESEEITTEFVVLAGCYDEGCQYFQDRTP